MDRAFDTGNHSGEQQAIGKKRGQKRKETDTGLAGCVMPEKDDKIRHRTWVSKASNKAQKISWRPKPMYRAGAKRFLAELDNQIRISTPLSGLVHYQKKEQLQLWKNWRDWPHLSSTHDLGSDVLCGSHAAENFFKLNYTKFSRL